MNLPNTNVQLHETDPRFPYKIFTNKNVATWNHWHNELEMILLLDRGMACNINGVYYTVSEGEVVFAAPGDIHGIQYSENERLVIQFKPDMLENKYSDTESYRRLRDRLKAAQRVSSEWGGDAQNEIRELMLKLWSLENSGESELAYRLKVQALLCEIVALILERAPECEIQHSKNLSLENRNNILALEKVFTYIHSNFDSDITPDDAAAVLNYSTSYFLKFWRKNAGIPLHSYINEYRVNKAMILLSETDQPISKIGLQVGFSSLKTFNRVFKSVAGVSPSEYRRLIMA